MHNKKNKLSKKNNIAVNHDEWVDKPKDTKSTLKRLMRELGNQKYRLVLIVISTFISCLLLVLLPVLMGKGIDIIIATVKEFGLSSEGFKQLMNTLLSPVLSLVIVSLLCCIAAFTQQRLMASVGEILVLNLRKQISEKLTKLPLNFFDTHKTGDLLSRTTDDLEKVAEVMQTGTIQLISSFFSIIVTLIVMLILNPLLTLIALSSLAISCIATTFISKVAERSFAQNQKTIGELNAKIEEFFSGNVVIKTFNKQEDSIREVSQLNQNQYKAHKKAQFVNYAIYPSIRFLSQLGFIATAVYGGFLVVAGQMTIGTIQAMLQYINQLSEPTTTASYVINSLQGALAATERVFEILDEEEQLADSVDAVDAPNDAESICFEHVKFGYSKDKILMNDISLDIRPNETVAIVGPTGAGKTTLVNLLMRFYELNGGKISISGIDIKNIKRGQLCRMIGIVLQDSWLFQGTVADNIAYGKMNATRAEIVAAATAARCDHFIRTLPSGYDTIISSENSSISQGQMQLLTIARAILASPAIMILDEATSSVDTRTEMEIQKAMNDIMQNKTSFVIAHRLSTIKSADLILVMKNGTIIEKGTHTELLSAPTFYADLYNSQFVKGTEI